MLRLSQSVTIPRSLPFSCSSSLPLQQQQPHLRSSHLVTLEYADLNLSYHKDQGHVRIRQHVNPLSSSFSVPAQVPDWNQVFADPTLPLMVDIGCGSGRFLMWLAKRTPKERNYLGLEIRQKMVKRAELWVKDLALDNIHFLFANATISFKQLVESYPGPLMLVSILASIPTVRPKGFPPGAQGRGRLRSAAIEIEAPFVLPAKHYNARIGAYEPKAYWPHCIYLRVLHQEAFYFWLTDFTPRVQCPDPHFKKRHHKRRVLQKPLVGAIVDNLEPGGQVFVQSDVLEIALDMRNQFDEVDALKHVDALNSTMSCDNEGWFLSNPMGIRTEREIHAEFEGAKIYRRLYQKQI